MKPSRKRRRKRQPPPCVGCGKNGPAPWREVLNMLSVPRENAPERFVPTWRERGQ